MSDSFSQRCSSRPSHWPPSPSSARATFPEPPPTNPVSRGSSRTRPAWRPPPSHRHQRQRFRIDPAKPVLRLRHRSHRPAGVPGAVLRPVQPEVLRPGAV